MDIITIKALQDNFMYLLIDKETNVCAAVDPVEPKKLIDYVTSRNLRITHILTTHHHWDHAGGNKELFGILKGAVTVCGGEDRVEAINMTVSHGQKLIIGSSVEVECYHTPCHTTGHICYVARCSENEAVFTGDTLFIAGCGRFFEGTATEMVHALLDTLAKLPASTLVYCGHEYTLKNLNFALTIEPNNENIQKKIEWTKERSHSGLPTVPSTIGEELLTNPFMRVKEQTVLNSCGCTDHIKAMDILRSRKDKF